MEPAQQQPARSSLEERCDNNGGDGERPAVGIWIQWPVEARWANEGMTRLLAFLIEGFAQSCRFTLRVLLPDSIRDVAEQDLCAAGVQIGRVVSLHSPRDHSWSCNSFADLAAYANNHVPVDGWLTLFPNFAFARLLNAPVTAIFPDAIPRAFHEFTEAAWGRDGVHRAWTKDVAELLSHASGAIAFSEHVATEHINGLFGFPIDRITTIRHAAPDLKEWLPFMKDRRRTGESLCQAASLLREECLARNSRYLGDFPFEQVPYVAVSTQDRVTKNIQVAARAIEIITRRHRRSIKMFMTASLHAEQNWTALPEILIENMSRFDIISLSDLPRTQHAALLHCAELVVHPSIFEGGHAPFPFYEALSVGTPCIMAFGPHIEELAAFEPNIRNYCFDPNDEQALAERICEVVERREEVLAEQQEIYRRLRKNDWAAVANAYADTALRPKLNA